MASLRKKRKMDLFLCYYDHMVDHPITKENFKRHVLRMIDECLAGSHPEVNNCKATRARRESSEAFSHLRKFDA